MCGFYRRHGYTWTADAPFYLPHGGPAMWPMVRHRSVLLRWEVAKIPDPGQSRRTLSRTALSAFWNGRIATSSSRQKDGMTNGSAAGAIEFGGFRVYVT